MKTHGISYRLISRRLQNEDSVLVPEPTIANWIYYDRVPGKQKDGWFKSKSVPSEKLLRQLYLHKLISPDEICKTFGVTGNTVRKWLTFYGVNLRDRKRAMNTPRTKELLRNHRLIKPPKTFRSLTTEKAYILGVLCGDGHISARFAQLEISKEDKEFIHYFVECFKKVYGLKFNCHDRPKRKTLVTYISPEFICKDLLSYGNFGVRKWKVPNAIMESRRTEVVTSFLRGIYDSEGCVTNKHNAIMFSVVNRQGAAGVVKLLNRIGIKTTFHDYLKPYKTKARQPYLDKVSTVGIYGKANLIRFRDLINFTIKRKRERLGMVK